MTDWGGLAAELQPMPEGKCLLALSGGADSMALLYMLVSLRDAGRITLSACHVNHGIRGDEADADEQFVRESCESLRVPCVVRHIDLKGRTDENTAREARWQALEDAVRETGAEALILAHHRRDQAETLMMRLMRGAGPEGMRGMLADERRDGYRLIRPMLEIDPERLKEALREDGKTWREDSTNVDSRYLRNDIRTRLIPLMEEMAPGATGRIARAAGLAAGEQEALKEMTDRFLRDVMTEEGDLNTDGMRELPEPVKTRILRGWWRRVGPERDERALSYDQTRALSSLETAEYGTTINLPGGWRARRRKHTIHMLSPNDGEGKETK